MREGCTGIDGDPFGRSAVGVVQFALDADRGVVAKGLFGREEEDELGVALPVLGGDLFTLQRLFEGELFGIDLPDPFGGDLRAVDQVDGAVAGGGVGAYLCGTGGERDGSKEAGDRGECSREAEQGVPARFLRSHHLESFFCE